MRRVGSGRSGRIIQAEAEKAHEKVAKAGKAPCQSYAARYDKKLELHDEESRVRALREDNPGRSRMVTPTQFMNS